VGFSALLTAGKPNLAARLPLFRWFLVVVGFLLLNRRRTVVLEPAGSS
jgi:hypothetical protein